MRWLYNVDGRELSQDLPDEGLILGEPKARPWETVEELEAEDLVGIYEVNPSIGSMTLVVFATIALLVFVTLAVWRAIELLQAWG